MEFQLRCNSLKCRKEVKYRAVVTTCSHVFCMDCSNQFQLNGSRNGSHSGPMCPACDAHLPKPDDVIVTNLNPTEDYKTSVLSGLSPNLIMECATRAMSFWSYQASQEIVYQEFMAKTLRDKYTSLNGQAEKIVHDANSEISSLRNQMSNMQVDQDNLREKHEELINAYREKNRKLLLTQELYDKLKKRSMLGQVQNAASDAVDYTIQESVTTGRFVDRLGNQNHRLQQVPVFSDEHDHAGIQSHTHNGCGGLSMAPPSGRGGNGDAGLERFASQNSRRSNDFQPEQTPSTHRQRLSTQIPRTQSVSQNIGISPNLPRAVPNRQPLTGLSANSLSSGFAGHGLSAGLKVSNPAGSVQRPRVAQRPGPGPFPIMNPPPDFASSNMFSNGGARY